MALIAEAFVAIRPDFSSFAADLRTQLPREIAKVGAEHRKISLIPVLDSQALGVVREQLAGLRAPTVFVEALIDDASLVKARQTLSTLAEPIFVPIIPVLDIADEAAIRTRLESITATVKVDALVNPATTAAVGKQVQEEIRAGAAAAGAGAAAAAGGVATVGGGILEDPEAIRRKTETDLRDRQQRLVKAVDARIAAELALAELEGKEETDAANALRRLELAQEDEAIARDRVTRAEETLARATNDVAALRARQAQFGGSPLAAGAAAATAGAARAQASTLGLSKESIAALQNRVEAELGASSAAIQKVTAAETSLRDSGIAVDKAQRALAAAEALEAEVLADQTLSLEARLASSARVVELEARLASALEKEVIRRNALLRTQALASSSTTAGVVLGANEAQQAADARVAQLAASAQSRLNESRTQESLAGGRLSPRAARQAVQDAAKLEEQLALEVASIRKQEQSATVQADREHLAKQRQILEIAHQQAADARIVAEQNRIAGGVASARVSVPAAEKTLGTKAAIGNTQAVAARVLLLNEEIAALQNRLTQAALGQSAASKEQIAATLGKISAYQKEVTELNVLIQRTEGAAAAQFELAQASAVADRQFSQARRGVFAASLGFAGFRGAVLASSAPFLAATVAITAFGKALQTTAELQKQLLTFAAVAGATGDQMKRVGALARQLGADITLPATSSVDAAVALTELSKAGLSLQDSMQAARGTLQLAAAASISASDAAQLSASVLNQYSLAGSKASKVTDVLAGASIAAQGSISDFGQGFKSLGAVAATAGVTLQQSAALLAELGKAGLAGADGGTAIRTFLQRLVPESKPAREAMADLGVKLDRTKTVGQQLPQVIAEFTNGLEKLTPIARQDALNKIFGSRGIRAATIIFNQGADGLINMTNQLSKSGYAADLTEARMKGLAGAVDALGSSGSTLATTLGQYATPALTSVVHAATTLINTLSDVAQGLKPVADTIGDIFNAIPGGNDFIAQLGLIAAAGLGVGKVFDRIKISRAEAKGQAITDANQQILALGKVEAAVDRVTVALKEQSIAAETTAKVFVGATAEQIAAEFGLASAITKSNTALETQGGLAANAGRRAGLLSGGLGRGGALALTGGIAASIAGDKIGGPAGQALSTTGQLATFGFVAGGVPGAVAGTAAGLVASALSISRGHEKAEFQKVKDEWNKMTPQEQRLTINADPKRWTAMISFFDLTVKQIKVKPTLTADALRPDEGVAGPTGTGLTPQIQKILAAQRSITQVGPAARIQLEIARAQASGDTEQLRKAFQHQLELDNINIKRLDDELKKGVTKERGKEIVKSLTAYLNDKKQMQDAIKDLLGKSSDFDPRLAAANLLSTQAQGTKSLVDDLSAAEAIYQAQVARLRALRASGKATKEEIAQALIDVASANNDIIAKRNAIADQAKQVAEDRTQAEQNRLEIAAQQADHRGKAEAALIAFLKAQIVKAKGNTLAVQAAQKALADEQQTQTQALAQSRSLREQLQDQIIQNQLAAADLTPSNTDNKRVLNRQLGILTGRLNEEIAIANEVKKKSGAASDAYIAAKIEVQKVRGQITGVKQALKGLTGGDSGFSLNDLFKASIDQFNQFAGNIASRSGLFTAGDVRGTFAGQILSQGDMIKKATQDTTKSIRDSGAEIAKAITDSSSKVADANKRLFVLPGKNPGLLQKGNIDLLHRKIAHNPDGSISTVKSFSVGVDGREVLLPSVINGRVVSQAAAIKNFQKTGQNLGTFSSTAAATAYAKRLHKQQENYYMGMGSRDPVADAVTQTSTAQLSESQKQTGLLGEILSSIRGGGQSTARGGPRPRDPIGPANFASAAHKLAHVTRSGT